MAKKKPKKRTNSRAKGCRGERELSQVIRTHGYAARRGQQYSGGGDSPDVVTDIPGLHIECKRVETFNLYKSLAQAKRDGKGKVPVVAHKRNRENWVAVLEWDTFLNLLLLTPAPATSGASDGQ